jgi:curved DNA-binding protein
MDLSKFTERSQAALTEAQNIATRNQHQAVDIEHLLLALLSQEGGLIPRLFERGRVEPQTFKVRIPVGVQEGQTIRVPGKGGEGANGGASGDLFLHVLFAAHPDFRARGPDLYYELNLAPWEAVLGTKVSVPTLENPVNVRIPAGTNNGQQLRVRDRGLPRGRNGERGDIYAVVNVQLPSQLSDEERELWEKLSRVSRFSPRQPAL